MKNTAPTHPQCLRILILSAKGGGTGSALRALYVADALRQRGHEVVCPPLIPTLPLWLDMALAPFWYLPFALFRPYDAVWCVKPYPSLAPACWVQRLWGAKVVFDVDDLDWAYSHGAFRKVHRLFQTPWPKWGDFATYHNVKLREVLLKEFGLEAGRLVRVPQGVDPDLFHPKSKGDTAPSQPIAWDPKRRPHLVFTAHLNVACDLGELLISFKSILKRHPKATLMVAGGGSDQRLFEERARSLGLSDHVVFTGMLRPSQVADYLRSSDAVLVYYRDNEANRHRASLKAREALSCGCRVVATKVGDVSEWGAWATLSKPNPEAFAAATSQALRARRKTRPIPKSWTWVECVSALEKRLTAS